MRGMQENCWKSGLCRKEVQVLMNSLFLAVLGNLFFFSKDQKDINEIKGSLIWLINFVFYSSFHNCNLSTFIIRLRVLHFLMEWKNMRKNSFWLDITIFSNMQYINFSANYIKEIIMPLAIKIKKSFDNSSFHRFSGHLFLLIRLFKYWIRLASWIQKPFWLQKN